MNSPVMRRSLNYRFLTREHMINLPHDPLCPLNRSRDHGVGSGARLGIEEIVGSFQVTRQWVDPSL
jgi:hypothetical protein